MTETKPHATLAASVGAHPAHTGAAASGFGALTMDATPDAPVVPVWFLSAEELASIDALDKGVRGGPDPDQPQPQFLDYKIPEA